MDQSFVAWGAAAGGGEEEIEKKHFSFEFTPTCYAQVVKKEIAWLELEIMNLERHLLSLYKNAYQHKQRLVSIHDDYDYDYNHDDDDDGNGSLCQVYISNDNNNTKTRSSCQVHQSPKPNGLAGTQSKDADLQAASPLNFKELEKKMDVDHHHRVSRSLADHLGSSSFSSPITMTTTFAAADTNTPDRVSEEIVKCISCIYYKLANPISSNGIGVNSTNSSASISSSSLSSSSTIFYPEIFYDDNEKWRPYYGAVQVSNISIVDTDDIFNYVAKMLEKFRSLVKSLEKVDPMKMKREEKLAFWINIHNALVMHAHFAYGTRDRVKSSSFLEASYNVGGHSINAYTIQTSILGISSHYSLPWLQNLFSAGNKSKTERMAHVYAIGYSEPLLHFALCSGAYFDPPVRVYRAKNMFEDLKLAKEEFIRASIHIHKGKKLVVPKIFNYFAKDMSLDVTGLLKEVRECLSEGGELNFVTKCLNGTSAQLDKCIHWLSQSSRFRYIIHRQLAQEILSSL